MAEANPVVELSLDTISKNKQALVFAESKKSAEKVAEEIARSIKGKRNELDELARKILKALPSPTKQCVRLAACVKKGIAFHHAGLVAKQRDVIEQAFREGLINTICATPTLAFGVDLPAFRVIIKSLKRYSGAWGMDWIPVLEYHQMCGRAGRPRYQDSHGEAVVIARSDGESEELYSRYVTGQPEDIESKLAVEPVLRVHVLSLIATGFVRSRQQLIDFFSQTFLAHQEREISELCVLLDKVIRLLEQWEFISVSRDDFVSAADMNIKEVVVPTLLGRRVAELYLDPLTAHHFIRGLQMCKMGASVFGLLQLVSNTKEVEPRLRVGSKEYEKMKSVLLEHYSELLEMEPNLYDPEYDDFLDSIKTAVFLNDWVSESSEEKLLEEYGIRPGEVWGKITIADWLLYTMEEIAPLLKMHNIVKDIRKLRMRVQHGVREELLTLLRLEGVGRVRARRLYRAGIKDIGDVKKADLGTLGRLIGQKTALKVKKQVGQEPVKNEGQVGLGKY